MTAGLSLRSKVLLVALLNAVLIAAALVWFTRTQLTQDLGTLLLGESRERVTAVAMELARELPKLSEADRDPLLERFSKRHGVTFRLFHTNGAQVAGARITPPEEVASYIQLVRAKSPLVERPAVAEALVRDFKKASSHEKFDMQDAMMNRLLAVVGEPPVLIQAEPGYWAVIKMPLRSIETPGSFQPGLLLMTSSSVLDAPFLFDLRPWLGLGGLIIVIALLCWLPLVRGVTRATENLAAATAKIARGDFGAKVELGRSDELGQLAGSFNSMARQLEGYVRGQKSFLRDAAHELRSPIARMQAALGNILESRVGPEVEPLLEDVREEIDLMSSLTGELLTFAREENEKTMLRLMPVSLAEVAAKVVQTENPGGKVEVRLDLEPDAQVAAHLPSLFRGLSNVVRNAIRYAGDDGPITVAAERRNGATVVIVKDSGPGIPEDALEMVFTPFYRLDVSRNRNTGGNGLGMAIARSCFEACKGTIHCRNGNPGLEVVITLQNA